LLELFSSPSTIGRSVVAPPGVPPERVKLLRDAFMAAIQDEQLIAAAKTAKLDLDPLSGEELQATIGSREFSPASIARARQLAETAQ
jgi:tripartite-type tricarboxylate transporter receptor subunit TctC